MSRALNFTGQVELGDVHGRFPNQKQPRITIPDYLTQFNTIALDDAQQFKVDSVLGCCYAEPVFVPHNQRITAAITVTDADMHLLSGVPGLLWSTFTVGGPNAVQDFSERPWGNQRIDVHCTDESMAGSMTLNAIANSIRNLDGSTAPLQTQGLKLRFTRSIFPPMDSTTACYFNVYCTVGGYVFGVQMGVTAQARVVFSDDGGSTFRTLRADLKAAAPHVIRGNSVPTTDSDTIEIEFLVMNAQFQIRVNGQSAPYVAPLSSNCVTSIVNAPGTTGTLIGVTAGSGSRFPPASLGAFQAYCYPPGAAPSAANAELLTVTAINQDNFTVTRGSPARNIKEDWTLAFLNPLISQIQVRAAYFTQIGLSGHPMMWATQASFRSVPHQLGFTPDATTPPYYSINSVAGAQTANSGVAVTPLFPTNSTFMATTVAGTAQSEVPQYDFVMTNPAYGSYGGQNYALQTACVTRIATKIDGIVQPASGAITVIPLDLTQPVIVKEVRETLAFDVVSLTVNHSCDITFSNWQGIDAFAGLTGVAGSGNISVAMRMGLNAIPDPDPHKPGWPHFVGMCDTFTFTRAQANMALLTLSGCWDQMTQLGDVYLFAPPDLDGMYHYYAMQLLGEFAGISADQMAFYAIDAQGRQIRITVPDDPFAADPNDPEPYFLPMGVGMHPWTPINRQLPVRELMDMVRKVAGFLLFYDENGLMTYLPWIPPNAGAPKRVFTEFPVDAAGVPGGAISEIISLSAVSSTRDTRNQVILIGQDAFGDGDRFIITKYQDDASINSPPGQQPRNYIGYPKALLWMDSRFALPGFANKTARRMYNFLRQPAYTVNFTCWLQPDLYPMDVIYVEDSKSNSGAIPFYIMSLSHTLSVMGGKVMQTSISARYLDPIALAG